MDANALRAKIEWEGGVLDAMDYGIRDDDIEDEELATAWADMSLAYADLSDDIFEFEETLNEKCDALDAG